MLIKITRSETEMGHNENQLDGFDKFDVDSEDENWVDQEDRGNVYVEETCNVRVNVSPTSVYSNLIDRDLMQSNGS